MNVLKNILKKIHLTHYFLFLISLIITSWTYFFIKDDFRPIKIEVEKNVGLRKGFLYTYKDLDKDGFSEKIIIGNTLTTPQDNIVIQNYSGKTLEQFNFNGKILSNGVLYGNLDHDQYDEILVFYKNNDNIYFDIIDFQNLNYLYRGKFLISKPDSAKGEFWDVAVSNGSQIIGLDNDGGNEILLGLRSGYSVYPRSLLIFDFNEMKITKKFETGAPFINILTTDFNNDGKKEIVLLTYTSGNTQRNALYNDHTSWVFYLDDKLNLTTPSKQFGTYPTSGTIAGIIKQSNSEKSFIHLYQDLNNKLTYISEYNADFNLINQKEIRSEIPLDIFYDVHQSKNNIYLTTASGKILNLSDDLQIIRSVETKSKALYFLMMLDCDNDGNDEPIFIDQDGVYVYDTELNLLADIKHKLYFETGRYYFNLKENGIGAAPQLAYTFESNVLFALSKNKYHFFLWVILLFILVSVFSLMLLFKAIVKNFYLYLRGFSHFIYKTDAGYCIINEDFSIRYVNNAFLNSLLLEREKVKRQNSEKAFIRYPSILSSLNNSRETKEPIVEKLTINNPQINFNGEIGVYPLKIFNKKVLAYIIEIKNFTKPILEERLEIWGKSVQKIAHDIKTPLSTIALNLKSIQINLEKAGNNNPDIMQDIFATKNEIERIKNLTKNFLKFVDLDKPSFQAVEVNELINNSLMRFEELKSDNLKIDYTTDCNNKLVWADPRQIELVIHIFIENSIDALSGNGLILIESELVQDLEDDSTEYVQISVTDNGPGISKELIDKVFEPHFSTKRDGTGMGLSFGKKIIRDNRGIIELHSKEGFGTTIRFTLPVFKE